MKVIASAAVLCVLTVKALSAAVPSLSSDAKGIHKEVVLFPARKRGLQLVAAKKAERTSPDPAAAGVADERTDDAAIPADEDDFGGASAPPKDGDDEPGATAAPVSSSDVALPPISKMTGTASETIKTINSQASILEAKVAQAQMENEAKLARQKAVFENKLQDQDRKNRAVTAENSRISQEIKVLKQGNQNMRKRAHELQEENKFKRTELRTLRERLTVADDFISNAMKVTDDRKAQEVAVLQSSQVTGERQHNVFGFRRTSDTDDQNDAANEADDDGEDTDDDKETDADEDEGSSFLEIAAKVRRASVEGTEEAQLAQMADVEAALSGASGIEGVAPVASTDPRDLINVLSSGINTLSKQERASEAKLRTMFLTKFKAGTNTHTVLMKHQQELNSTRASLRSEQSELQVATSHLDNTRGKLEQQLHGLGSFLQRLAHLAFTPVQEAPGLLKALPAKIVLQDKAKGTLKV